MFTATTKACGTAEIVAAFKINIDVITQNNDSDT